MTVPALVDVGGRMVRKLTLGDFMDLLERFWHEQRRALIQDMDDAHIGDAAKAESMQRHQLRRGSPDLLVYAAFRVDGARSIVERALKVAGHDPASVLDTMTPTELVLAARQLAFDETAGASGPKPEATSP